MTAVTFDTHKFIKRLEAAGIAAPQAEAMSDAVREAVTSQDVVSGADAQQLRHETKGEIEQLRQENKTEFQQLRHEMSLMRKEFEGRFTLLQWMLGVVVAGVATLVVKSFF